MIKVGELRRLIQDLPDEEQIVCCAYSGTRGVYFRVKTAKLMTMYDNSDMTRVYASEKIAEREKKAKRGRPVHPVPALVIKDIL